MAKAIMIQGTGSGAGKSVIAAGLCRIFRNMGIKVAPFKANMRADDYYDIKEKAWKYVTEAYDRLAEEYDLIVIEGAGSPAEINLREEEIVNMKVARYADAPVILVGDIDKGGVFAAFYGTVGLLKDPVGAYGNTPLPEGDKTQKSDADYIKAFIVNKFRGDINILRPGLRQIEDKTGKPVIGVLNYQEDLGLDEEDAIERWADILGKSVDICFILREVGMEYCMNHLPEDLK